MGKQDNTTRATAAVLEAIQALDNAGVEYAISKINRNAAIQFRISWQELGFCHRCGIILEDDLFKECEKCRRVSGLGIYG